MMEKTSTSDIHTHTQEEDVSIYELIFIEKTHVPLYIDPDTIRLPPPHTLTHTSTYLVLAVILIIHENYFSIGTTLMHKKNNE